MHRTTGFTTRDWLGILAGVVTIALLASGIAVAALNDNARRERVALDQAKAYAGTWKIGRISPDSQGYDLVLQPTKTASRADRKHLGFDVPHPDEPVLQGLCPGDKVKLDLQGHVGGANRFKASGYLRIFPL